MMGNVDSKGRYLGAEQMDDFRQGLLQPLWICLGLIYDNKSLKLVQHASTKEYIEITPRDKMKFAISSYAMKSEGELWAESFTAYFLSPDILEERDPIMFALMREVMRDIYLTSVPQQPSTGASSPAADTTQNLGGIDLRVLPTVIQPNLGLQPKPLLSPRVPLVLANLTDELQEIERMIKAGIIPSSERIREYLLGCCEREDYAQEINQVIACIAEILKLEEERVTETEAALKEILVAVESDKKDGSLKLALSQIQALPQEPKPIE